MHKNSRISTYSDIVTAYTVIGAAALIATGGNYWIT